MINKIKKQVLRYLYGFMSLTLLFSSSITLAGYGDGNEFQLLQEGTKATTDTEQDDYTYLDDDVSWQQQTTNQFSRETIAEALDLAVAINDPRYKIYDIEEVNNYRFYTKYIYHICELVNAFKKDKDGVITQKQKDIIMDIKPKDIFMDEKRKDTIMHILRAENGEEEILDFYYAKFNNDRAQVVIKAIKNPKCKVREVIIWSSSLDLDLTDLAEAIVWSTYYNNHKIRLYTMKNYSLGSYYIDLAKEKLVYSLYRDHGIIGKAMIVRDKVFTKASSEVHNECCIQ